MKGKRSKRSREGSYTWKGGNLYARLQYLDDFGKLKEKTRRVQSNKISDVWAIIKEFKNTLKNQGEDALRSDRVTFEQLAERYKQAKVFPAKIKDGKKVAGLKSYKPIIGNINVLNEYFKKKLIRSIKPFDIENFKNQRLNLKTRLGKERKVASVNRELSTLRTMFNYAVRNEWIASNPCLKVEKLVSASLEVERDRILSFDEERRLFDVLTERSKHIKPILICALDTGMRPEEIFKLTWQDVDLENKAITIIAQNSKTEKIRHIGITSRLLAGLVDLWNGSPRQKDLSVFGTKSIKTAFNTACRLAGLKDLRFRDFRHTATTRMILSGMSQTEVMKITGHTQMKTFIRYVNLTKESVSESMQKLSNFVEERSFITENVNDSIN